MSIQNSVKEILAAVGGEQNVVTVTHCMTRLRFVLKDDTIAIEAEIKKIPGVIGVAKKGGQCQIICGNDVANYYKELIKLGHFEGSNQSPVEKVKPHEAVLDYISGSMSSLLAALAAGGMIQVLLIVLPMLGVMSEGSKTFAFLSIFGDASFYFMPILLAASAAKKLGVTPMLAMTVAGIMLHPDFVNMVNSGEALSVFGLPVVATSYSSTVIPILLTVWVMKYLEMIADKFIPVVIKSILKPMFVVIVAGIIALVAVGPLGAIIGDWLAIGITWMHGQAGWLTMGVFAALMPLIIMTGMHWAFIPLAVNASVATPDLLLLPAMFASNMAQGSASLAVALKSKNSNTKQLAISASISALAAGITEPALYGITLKFKKPLIAAMISSAVAGIYLGITNVASFALVTPAIIGLPQFMAEGHEANFTNAVIVAAIAVVGTFVLTWIFGIDEEAVSEPASALISDEVTTGSSDSKKIFAPVSGEIVPLSKVDDEVFAQKLMGEGIAIQPKDDLIVAPFDGEVATIFPTKHAIGLVSEAGIELLIHVGIDTVQLNGKHFEALVESGQKIKKGQPLLKVDFNKVKKEGYDTVTPIIVTNTANFIEVVPKDELTSATLESSIIYVL